MRVRPARPEDAGALAPRLREADLREIQAVTREAPVDVLRGGIAASDPGLVLTDAHDEILAVFGVIPGRPPGMPPDEPADGAGAVWLLGSNALVARPLVFLRLSRIWTGKLFERYRTLGNVIDARNEVHLRWLGWCGFVLGRTIEAYGVERRPFHAFSRTRPV